MGSPLHSLFLAFFFAFFASHRASRSLVLAQKSLASVDVGVVLDLGTETGKRSRTSISMAIDDFYALHGDHATRVVLHVRDSDKDAVGAAAAGTVSTTKPVSLAFTQACFTILDLDPSGLLLPTATL